MKAKNKSWLMSLLKWLIDVFNPPYQLLLCDRFSKGSVIYVFKQYGSHEYIKVTYNDIVSNQNLLLAINPINLMDIHLTEFLVKNNKSRYQVVEYLRNNQYKLYASCLEEIYSGDYICKNMDLFTNISPVDIAKIAFQSGFLQGRKFTENIKSVRPDSHKADLSFNVFDLNGHQSLSPHKTTFD